jgi:hypothetical protein
MVSDFLFISGVIALGVVSSAMMVTALFWN